MTTTECPPPTITPGAVSLFARLVHLEGVLPYSRHGTFGPGRYGTTLLLPHDGELPERLVRVPDGGLPPGIAHPLELARVIHHRAAALTLMRRRALLVVAVAADQLTAAGFDADRHVVTGTVGLERVDGCALRIEAPRPMAHATATRVRVMLREPWGTGYSQRSADVLAYDREIDTSADVLVRDVLRVAPAYSTG